MVEEARVLRDRGMKWAEIGRRLGVRPSSLQVWIRRTTPALLPVTIEPAAASRSPVELVLVTPEGFRVEGLDLESARELLESLRC